MTNALNQSAYRSACKQDNHTLIAHLQTASLQLQYFAAKKSDFERHYNPTGLFGRKLTAISRCFSCLVQAIYHYVQLRLHENPSDKGSTALLFHHFQVNTNLKQAWGCVVTLFDDLNGEFLVQDCHLRKFCYTTKLEIEEVTQLDLKPLMQNPSKLNTFFTKERFALLTPTQVQTIIPFLTAKCRAFVTDEQFLALDFEQLARFLLMIFPDTPRSEKEKEQFGLLPMKTVEYIVNRHPNGCKNWLAPHQLNNLDRRNLNTKCLLNIFGVSPEYFHTIPNDVVNRILDELSQETLPLLSGEHFKQLDFRNLEQATLTKIFFCADNSRFFSLLTMEQFRTVVSRLGYQQISKLPITKEQSAEFHRTYGPLLGKFGAR